MLEQKISASGWIPDSVLTAIGKQAYDELLGHLRSKFTPGDDPRIQRDVVSIMRDMFALLEVEDGYLDMDEGWEPILLDSGYGEERLKALRATLAHYKNGETAVADATVFGLLEQHGIAATEENYWTIRQELLTGSRKAFETMGERLLEKPSAASPPAAAPPLKPAAAPAPAKAAAPAATITEAAEACIQQNVKDGFWKEASCIQVRTAVGMFVFVNGDLPISDITQAHLGSLDDLCFRLPTKWNRTTDERKRGLQASLERARALPADQVGLSAKAREKHFTWLSAVIGWAAAKGKGKPEEALDFKGLRKGKKVEMVENELRLSWTAQELGTIFSAPVWHGCAGLFDRLSEGEHVWHDGWYWAPLGLTLMGWRSDEFAGCSLAEVHEDHEIPHIAVTDTAFRSLKGATSRRKLPIPTAMIRLGFFDYVRELRRQGQELLFPEFQSPLNKSGFDSVFYKTVFSKLRAHAFPAGTDWFRENGGRKEKDVHSLRGSTTNLLADAGVADKTREDILGHRGATTTRRVYDEPAELRKKLAALDTLGYLTADLKAHPLNLRPPEWLKFGQPRGRPANGGRAVLPRRSTRR